MNPNGRKPEVKTWETRFRHSFYTNYLQDPDLHVLLFLSDSRISDIMREALRDYMVKHGHQAADPVFQRQVFLAASLHVSRGHRPVASEVLAELGDQILDGEQTPPARSQHPRENAAKAPSPLPAQVISAVVPNVAPQVEAPEPTPTLPAVQVKTPQVQRTVSPVVQPIKKAPIVLDFGGPDLEMDAPIAEPAKESQRDKWLARHK